MPHIRFFLMSMALVSLVSVPALADPKPWPRLWWGEHHWQHQLTDLEYLHDAKIPHATRWERDEWRPQDWIDSRGSADAVIRGMFREGVIYSQRSDGDIPVLVAGQTFLDLSMRDKIRVARFLDHVYGISRNSENGLMRIVDFATGQPIGIYTSAGLQLQ